MSAGPSDDDGATAPSGSRARPTLRLGTRGLVAGFVGALGPAVARFESWRSESPAWVRGLGHPGSERLVAPALWDGPEGLRAAWCEEDGAWLSTIDLETGALGAARLVLPGARAIAIAAGAGDAVLFGADDEGFASVAIAPSLEVSEPRRHLTEHRADARIDAAALRDASLLVYTHAGSEAWGQVLVRGASSDAVRHPLARPCWEIRVEAAGGRAAVALELGSPGREAAGSETRMCLLAADGKVIERAHSVFPQGSPSQWYPAPVWTENEWTVLALEPSSGRLLAQPMGPKGHAFALPRCTGAFSVSYYARHLHALEAEPTGEEVELRLWRCARDGSHPQQRVVRVAVDDARERRELRQVRRTLEAVADRAARARGYRDQAASSRLHRDGRTLHVSDELGHAKLCARPTEGGVALVVVASSGEEPDLPETPGTLVRLAAWVTRRLSRAAREREETDRAWAGELASDLGAALTRVDHAGPVLALEVLVEAMPDGEALARWLRRLRDEQRERESARDAPDG